MQSKLLLFLCLFSVSSSFAQRTTEQRRCGTTFNRNEILRDAAKARQYYETERKIREAMRSGNRVLAGNDTLLIPVVFHIVSFDPTVVTDAMIHQQIATLNECYAGSNGDSINASGFYPVRGHAAIKFVLAKRSPRGCDTVGIERRANAMLINGASYAQIKHYGSGGLDAWESYNCKYLNIWVTTFIADTDGSTLLGKATFPDMNVPADEQGVVIDKKTLTYTYAGPGNSNFIYGKTLVHEVGHFFNLIHIWGDDGDETDKCSGTDEVADTPNQAVETTGRPVNPIFDVCSPAATVTGINYQNYMDYCHDTTLTMFTKLQVERILASFAVFPNRAMLISKKNKALTPKEDNQLFTQCNTAEFTTNNFTCVGVGKNGVVWAGSSQSGLYNYHSGTWHKYGSYVNNLYQDIKADKDGGIWVAQSGYNGAQAQTGGMLYFPDSLFPATPNYYGAIAGLPSRYPKSIFIDTSRYNVGVGGTINPLVWTANLANITAGVSSNGGLGRGFDPVAPNFIAIRRGLLPADSTGGTGSCYVVGGNESEIWTATLSNFGMSQILRYNAITNAFIDTYDTTNVLAGFGLGGNFIARGIYFDRLGRKWVPVSSAGIMIQNTSGAWKKINFPKIFPSTPFFYYNAITGDADGNVYIGTSSGLIVFSGEGSPDNENSYTLYTTANGLPSNLIKHIAVDTLRQKIILATDAGILFWNPVCAGGPAVDNTTFSTTASGDWSNPAVWCGGVVPPPGAKIIVRHPVTITTDTQCKSLMVTATGSFSVATGVNLTVGP